MNDFRTLIEAWPAEGSGVQGSARSLAGDLGIGMNTVRQWHWRNSIPPDYWLPIIAAAKARRIRGVTNERLHQFRVRAFRPLDRKRSSARAAA